MRGETLGVVLLGLGVVGIGVWLWPGTGASRDAPDFTAELLDGGTFTLSDHGGHVVVLEFFATWCTSCKITEQALAEAYPDWDPDEVVVVSVNVDPFEPADSLRAYRDEAGIPWAIVADGSDAARAYGVWELGRTVVIDPEGAVVWDHSGVATTGDLQEAVRGGLDGTVEGQGIPRRGLFALAALASVATLLSPCSVTFLPAFVASDLTEGDRGPSRQGRRSGWTRGMWAAAGLTTVLLGLGGLFLVGGTIMRSLVPFLQPVVGSVIVAIGVLHLVRPSVFDGGLRGLQRLVSGPSPRTPFLLGAAYGATASACTLPVLLQLGLLVTTRPWYEGLGVVLSYAGLAAALLLLLTLLAGRVGRLFWVRVARSARFASTAMGVLFTFSGLYMLAYWAKAAGFLF